MYDTILKRSACSETQKGAHKKGVPQLIKSKCHNSGNVERGQNENEKSIPTKAIRLNINLQKMLAFFGRSDKEKNEKGIIKI